MRELFFAYLENPTADSFQAVRAEVVRHENYDGYSRDLDRIEEAVNQGRFADAQAAFGEAQPNLLLSPRAHILMSIAHRELGHTQAAEAERFISFRCIDGIRSTGDGTKERPYQALRTSDEYDMLLALGKRFESQALVHADDGRSYDQIRCEDGTEYWFDITDLFAAMKRRLQE